MIKIYGLVAAVALALAVLAIKEYWPEYPDDNVVEESAEEIIYGAAGVDVDLTPNSPEKSPVTKVPTEGVEPSTT